MLVVGLISGGKDSFYNLVKCRQHGHEIVCLANLHPPSSSHQDELDSWMYQTVGHSAIEAYTNCFDPPLPLIRETISVASISGPRDEEEEQVKADEVEDLYSLLVKVKEQFPEVEA